MTDYTPKHCEVVGCGGAVVEDQQLDYGDYISHVGRCEVHRYREPMPVFEIDESRHVKEPKVQAADSN